jgi:hypothetical protein
MPIRNRAAILSNLLHINLSLSIPQTTTGLMTKSNIEAILSILQENPTTTRHIGRKGVLLSNPQQVSLSPRSLRAVLLKVLIHASLISTKHKRPSTYQLERKPYWAPFYMYVTISKATKGLVQRPISLIHTSHNRPGTHQLLRRATDHK